MSIASVVGYLTSINPADNTGFDLTVLDVPTVAPASINDGGTQTIVNATVIPKGKWLITGTIGLAVVAGSGSIKVLEVIISKGATQIYNIAQGGYNTFTINTFLPSIVFESDGTNTMTVDLIAQTMNGALNASGGPWQKDPDGVSNFIKLIKIGN